MNDFEQQEMNNKLMVAIVNDRTEKAKALLIEGANPLSYECMPIKEAINHDNLEILKAILAEPKNMQHIKDNLDKLYTAFITDREEKKDCLIYLIKDTDIEFQRMYENQGSTFLNDTIEFIKKIKLNTRLNEAPTRPRIKTQSMKMKI